MEYFNIAERELEQISIAYQRYCEQTGKTPLKVVLQTNYKGQKEPSISLISFEPVTAAKVAAKPAKKTATAKKPTAAKVAAKPAKKPATAKKPAKK